MCLLLNYNEFLIWEELRNFGNFATDLENYLSTLPYVVNSTTWLRSWVDMADLWPFPCAGGFDNTYSIYWNTIVKICAIALQRDRAFTVVRVSRKVSLVENVKTWESTFRHPLSLNLTCMIVSMSSFSIARSARWSLSSSPQAAHT